MSSDGGLDLELLPGSLAVCRLDPGAALPPWALEGAFATVSRTTAELSVICAAGSVPPGIRAEGPFRALRVRGVLDFALVGILARLTGPLAAAGVPLLAVSTFETDYVLVRSEDLDRARAALGEAGHHFDLES
jgi:hypothetical protein